MNAPPAPKPGFVRRTAPLFWSAGAYDFTDRPTFVMTADDNRRAVETFAGPAPLRASHVANPLDGKLGHVVGLFPSVPGDYQHLGCHMDLPAWADALFRDDSGEALPVPLSASWSYADKSLRHLALVNEPRIPDAAMFEACFAATGDPDVGRALDDGATDPGRMTTLEVEGDEDALEVLKQLAERMGCVVEDGPPTHPEGEEEDEMATGQTAAFEARLAALERENRELRAREGEARFERLRDGARRDAQAFAQGLLADDRIHPYQRAAVAAEFEQAALDDHRHPEEVHFSAVNADGTFAPTKGTRLDALKARYAALPKLGMLGELLPDRTEAAFDVAAAGTSRSKASPATVNRILASCDLGRVALASRNGHAKN